MAFNFTYDATKVSETSGVMKKGVYEVVVNNVEQRFSNNGTECMSFDLIVRNDVNQEYKNKHVFHNVWTRKDTKQYSPAAITRICMALGIENGAHFASIEEFFDECKGKTMKITVDHDEYNGQKREIVKYVNPTDFAVCNHVWKDGKVPGTGVVISTNTECPF